jgi:protocatechuate 3,4-dioxygenase beta subunit
VYAPATFTAHVYTDKTGNNTQDGTDTNLAGVTVRLLDGSGSAVLSGGVAVTGTTDASGNVSFTGLAPGSYQIAVTTPSGDVVTEHTNTSTVNVLASGGSASAIEGVYAPATFTAHVYTDKTGNNTQDGTDTNLSGVTVRLLDGSGNPVTSGGVAVTGTTDASGNVSFTGLAPGSYQIAVTTPSGDVVTEQTNVSTPITLTSGGTASAVEGVYVPASFTAHVYTDNNANGSQGSGDPNLPAVTVRLLDGSGNPVLIGGSPVTATTDASGNVDFTGLPPGTYQIAVVTPSGDIVSQRSNVNTPIVLTSGGTATAIEGVYAPASFTTHVYTDNNADSTQNTGDTHLPGATVRLLDGSGNPVLIGGSPVVGTTDANGNVTFTGLTPGSYQVAVVTPSGEVITQRTNVGTPIVLGSGGSATAIEGVVNQVVTNPSGILMFGAVAEARQLYIEARNADGGSLPSWLIFDPATKSFSGQPSVPLKTPLEIIVVVRDNKGNQTFIDVSILASAAADTAVDRGLPPDIGEDTSTLLEQLNSQALRNAIRNAIDQFARRTAEHRPSHLLLGEPTEFAQAADLPILPQIFGQPALVLEGRTAFTAQLHKASRMGQLAQARAMLDTMAGIASRIG